MAGRRGRGPGRQRGERRGRGRPGCVAAAVLSVLQRYAASGRRPRPSRSVCGTREPPTPRVTARCRRLLEPPRAPPRADRPIRADGPSDQRDQFATMISSPPRRWTPATRGSRTPTTAIRLLLRGHPGWRRFQSESDRVTGEFGSRRGGLAAQVDAVRRLPCGCRRPPQPEASGARPAWTRPGGTQRPDGARARQDARRPGRQPDRGVRARHRPPGAHRRVGRGKARPGSRYRRSDRRVQRTITSRLHPTFACPGVR